MKFSRNETVVHKEESVKQLSVRPWTRLRWLRPLLDANRPIPETQNEKKKEWMMWVLNREQSPNDRGPFCFVSSPSSILADLHWIMMTWNMIFMKRPPLRPCWAELSLLTLPAHLSLDPARTKVMEPLMFPNPCWGRVGISWIKLSYCRLCIRSNSGGLRILWTSILYC